MTLQTNAALPVEGVPASLQMPVLGQISRGFITKIHRSVWGPDMPFSAGKAALHRLCAPPLRSRSCRTCMHATARALRPARSARARATSAAPPRLCAPPPSCRPSRARARRRPRAHARRPPPPPRRRRSQYAAALRAPARARSFLPRTDAACLFLSRVVPARAAARASPRRPHAQKRLRTSRAGRTPAAAASAPPPTAAAVMQGLAEYEVQAEQVLGEMLDEMRQAAAHAVQGLLERHLSEAARVRERVAGVEEVAEVNANMDAHIADMQSVE